MTDTTRTHRCIDCPLRVEHVPSELCGCCGRCGAHCQGCAEPWPRGRTEQLELETKLGEGKVI